MCLVLSFIRKGKKVIWKLVFQNGIFLDAFSQLGLFNSVTDEVSKCLEKFVCALYGYKNETSSKNVLLKMFQMKGISDLALLLSCKGNLKLHISRANCVANMFVNAIKLHMCLDDPIYDKTVQFNEEMTASLKTSLFWKLLMKRWWSCLRIRIYW